MTDTTDYLLPMFTSQMCPFSRLIPNLSCRGSDASDLKMAEWVPVAEGPGEKAVEIETEEDGQ